jgi:hypothetical protein
LQVDSGWRPTLRAIEDAGWGMRGRGRSSGAPSGGRRRRRGSAARRAFWVRVEHWKVGECGAIARAFHVVVVHGSAELRAGTLGVVVRAGRVLDGGLDSCRNTVRDNLGGDLFTDDAGEVLDERAGLFLRECAVIAAAEFFGLGAFEEPGGGPPIFEHGSLHRAERGHVGLHFRPGEFVAEPLVRFALVADFGQLTADVAGSFFDAAAAGDESAELAEVGFVEGVEAIGVGRRGLGGYCGDHGLLRAVAEFANVQMYMYRVVRLA